MKIIPAPDYTNQPDRLDLSKLPTFTYQHNRMINQTLYKQDSKGNLRQWSVFVDGSTYYTVAGLTDGARVTSHPTQCKGKNIGRANATTDEEQALKQAEAKWEKKYKSGEYFDDPADIVVPFKFMLAKEYTEAEEKGKVNFPMVSSPKLDGVRNAFTPSKDRTTGTYVSRGNRYFATMNHCTTEMLRLYDIIEERTGLVVHKLDGEIYNDDYCDRFEDLVGLIKTEAHTITQEQLDKCEEVLEFHIFDVVLDMNFISRSDMLKEIFAEHDFKYIKLVDQEVVYNIEEVDEKLRDHLDAGYEGSILKNPKAGYVQKKDWNTLKYKLFVDEEFKIVSLLEGTGNWTGCAKMAWFMNAEGETFKATFTGSRELAQARWNDPSLVVGKMATVKYQAYTKRGVPRFGTIKTIRDYE